MADGLVINDNSSVDINHCDGVHYKHSLSDDDILARGKPGESRQRKFWENEQRNYIRNQSENETQQRGLSQSQTEYDLRERNNSEGNDYPPRTQKRSLPSSNVYLGHRRNWSGDMAYLHYMDPGNEQCILPVLNNMNNNSFYSPQPSPRHAGSVRENPPVTNNEFPRSESMTNMNIRHQLSTPNFSVSSSPILPQHSVSFDGNSYPSEQYVLYPRYHPHPHGFIPSQHHIRPYMVSQQAASQQHPDGHMSMAVSPDYRYRQEFRTQIPEYPPQFIGRPRVGSDDYNTSELSHHRNSLEMSDYWCKQQISFLNLQTATSDATNVKEELEKQVRELEGQLNQMSAVESNPTERETRTLEGENKKLEFEINKMYSELDMINAEEEAIKPLNTPVYPQEPTVDYFPPYTPERLYNENGEPIGINTQPKRPINKKLPPPPPITTQPPPYIEVSSPINNRYENVPSRHHLNNPNLPPPVPPHIPIMPQVPYQDDENWTCPRCTFKNLAIPKCEMCELARPIVSMTN